MAGAHTQHSKASLTSSGLNLVVPKCENTFFCTQERLKSTQQANPIEVWTIEPNCTYMWVPLSVCPCVIFFFKYLLLRNYLSDFDEISQK